MFLKIDEVKCVKILLLLKFSVCLEILERLPHFSRNSVFTSGTHFPGTSLSFLETEYDVNVKYH